MNDELKPPYEYSREEFYELIDQFRGSGPCSSQKYNGKTDWDLIRHIERIRYMSFGVHEWLYNKAMKGDEEALFDLNYSYDLYSKVQQKAKETGLI